MQETARVTAQMASVGLAVDKNSVSVSRIYPVIFS